MKENFDKEIIQTNLKTEELAGIKSNKEIFDQKNVKLNQLFTNYFKDALLMNSKEYEKFLETSIQKLPITFRVNKMNAYCDFIETEITKFIFENCESIQQEDHTFLTNLNSSIQRCTSKPIYKRFNWGSLDNIFSFKFLDKKKPENKEFLDLLKRENDNGILRQELVSMIPVSLVNLSDQDVVLDMCAAPGNKSVQILELMYERARERAVLPSGLLVSNEILQSRADKLINFLQSQPAINVMVTKCQAESFPVNKGFAPDVIFCDVPCSGDGTTRKNTCVRKKWKPSQGLVNHRLQIKILEKALVLCKKGGKIVYSTCSINPLENEAVVAHLLDKYKGFIELEDCKERVDKEMDLKFSEGLVKWKVPHDWKNKDNNIEWVHEYSNVTKHKSLIRKSMFHEDYTKKNFANNIYYKDPLNLRRCLRFYSHQNNSGSFFVAVIRKLAEHEIDKKNEIDPFNNPLDCENENNKKNKNSKLFIEEIQLNEYKNTSIKDDFDELCKMFGKTFPDEKKEEVDRIQDKKETENHKDIIIIEDQSINKFEESIDLRFDKYVKLKDYKNSFDSLIDFFDIKNEIILDSLYTSRHSSSKLFLFSKKLAEIVPLFADMNINMQYAGLLAFDVNRKNNICKYRLSYYGTLLLEKYIGSQKIELDINNKEHEIFFKQILTLRKVPFDQINQEIRKIIFTFKIGTIIIIFDSFVINARKGKNNLNIMIPDNKLQNIIVYLNKYFFDA